MLLADGCVGACLGDAPGARAAPRQPRRPNREAPRGGNGAAGERAANGAANGAAGSFQGQSAGPSGPLSADEAAYRAAIEDARAGRNAQALAVLKPLSDRYPERSDILGDYLVVLGWAGEDAAALALTDRIDRDKAPAYVLEGLAGSARRQQQGALAEALYTKSAARFPQRIEPRIGLIRTAMDAGRMDDATRQAVQLRQENPRNAAVLMANADLAFARGDYFAALNAYQAVLADAPNDRAALQGKARTLARMGTPQLAQDIARAHPEAFGPNDMASFAADGTAHNIRWGIAAADQGHGPERFAMLDRAIAESDAAAARALVLGTVLTPTERQLALDRISALQARSRMVEATQLYEAMAARPEPVPPYVKSAAASAYLYVQKPERARDLYREVVAADPADTAAQLGLFYALAENEEHKAALAQIEKLTAATPETINAYSAATTQPNPFYLPVQTARAMAPLLANQPGEAWERMRDLHARAPYSLEVDTSYASTMRARGWPRLAEQELRAGLNIDPYDSGTLGERAGALLEMRDYRGVEEGLSAGRASAEEDQRVRRSGRLWEVHNMRELIVESGYGRSSDGPIGNRDFSLDARLYSSPINYNYRAFTHLYTGQAKFDTGTGRYDRAGVGLEYRSTRYVASGEIAQDLNRSRAVFAGSVAYSPDDFWTLRGLATTSSTDTPLQARLAGVDARRFGLEAAWRAHESRTIAAGVYRMNFTDGNHRDSVQARWTERVVAGPVYKLEVTGTVAASRSSNTAAAYFNPSRDQETSVQLANEWLQWRRYERAFRHRVVLVAGNYWQQGFGSGPVYDGRYEQEWSADDRLVLRYGIGRSIHPYDGVRSARNYAFVALNWRF